MEKGLTSKLGEFVSQLRYQDIPPEALVAIRRAFTDCVGVMIAGAHEPAPQILKSTLAPVDGNATLFFGPERAPALDAALINATAAHALDFDDVVEVERVRSRGVDQGRVQGGGTLRPEEQRRVAVHGGESGLKYLWRRLVGARNHDTDAIRESPPYGDESFRWNILVAQLRNELAKFRSQSFFHEAHSRSVKVAVFSGNAPAIYAKKCGALFPEIQGEIEVAMLAQTMRPHENVTVASSVSPTIGRLAEPREKSTPCCVCQRYYRRLCGMSVLASMPVE